MGLVKSCHYLGHVGGVHKCNCTLHIWAENMRRAKRRTGLAFLHNITTKYCITLALIAPLLSPKPLYQIHILSLWFLSKLESFSPKSARARDSLPFDIRIKLCRIHQIERSIVSHSFSHNISKSSFLSRSCHSKIVQKEKSETGFSQFVFSFHVKLTNNITTKAATDLL